MNAKLLFSLARPTSGRSKYPGGCRLLYARRVFSLLGLWLLMNQTASWGQCFQNILDPTAYRLYPVGQGPYSVAVGDFNGDGKPDLATANFLNSVSVLLGDGAGGFGNRADFGAGFGGLLGGYWGTSTGMANSTWSRLIFLTTPSRCCWARGRAALGLTSTSR